MGKLFGTDGVRGIANKDLSPELAFHLGQAGAAVLSPQKKGKLVVGRDTRISGDLLESSLVSGICSQGVDVFNVEVMPTPAIAFLTKAFNADGGVVISASHNPMEYNGIKFFNKDGYKLSDELEEAIEKNVENGCPWGDQRPSGEHIGMLNNKEDEGLDLYFNHVIQTIQGDLDGFTIALDCANGSASRVSPSVLRELGANVLIFAAEPDGININKNCGSTYPEYLQEIVRSHPVDLGLAHDGDADRVIAVDEKGEIVDGDYILAICARHLEEKGLLKNDTVVTTVMTNLGFDLAMQKYGIKVDKTPVGDKFVLEEMLKTGSIIGGEQSGHIIFSEYVNSGDGLVTALQLIQVMKDREEPLSELRKILTRLPQVLLNVKVNDTKKMDYSDVVNKKIAEIEERLAGQGRILVRASGTEPLIRIMVEGKSMEEIQKMAEEMASLIEKQQF